MMLIPLMGFGYAQWSNTLTVVSIMQAGTESIRIAGCEVTYYNGYGDNTLEWDEDTVYFEYTNLFPGWELEIVVEIQNDGTIPVYLTNEIFYSWDEENWVRVENPEELYNEFRIVYTDALYNKEDELWDTNGRFWPLGTVYKVAHLLFDAQDRPDLQDKTFTIKIEIIGTVTR